MTDLPYFEVVGDFRAVLADAASDADYSPELTPISATVTFRALVDDGDILLATTATPRPTAYLPGPVTALIDPADGRLKLRTSPDSGGVGDFAPVKLLADSDVLELATPLHYRVEFSSVNFAGRAATIKPFTFQAPSVDGAVVNLVSVARAPGQQATGITRIAPGGVRQDGFDVIFTFDGLDLPGSVSLEALVGPTGATGATGSAATIEVGDVSTLAPGATATVVNTGSTAAAVLEFGVPQGATGADATVAIGSVTTGAAGSTASIVNVGTSGAAVFNVTIPRGDTGAQGEQGIQGIQGIQGEAGVSLDINGTVATYADLPGAPEPGDAYVVAGDGKLYFYDGASWPADGAGVPFVGPQGPQGIQGIQGLVGPVGPDGQAASIAVGTVTSGETAAVTNVGDSTSAVFDITLPIGPTGATGAVGTAATIDIDSTITGDPGSTASVENLGDTTQALFRFTLPRGDTGATGAVGATGATGATGAAGQAANLRGSVADYASLPTTGLADGDAYVAEDTGLLFVFNGTSFPAEGDGVPFVGPVGATGASGQAATVTIDSTVTGEPGSSAAVENLGDSTNAVLRFTVPAGATGAAGSDGADGSDGAVGPTGPQGEPGTTTWAGITDKPAVIAAGVDAAAARSVISAEYTGNKGQPNGYCALDASGLVPADQLPSFVEDVVEAADAASFPATGTAATIYVALDTGRIWRWGGSSYVEISPSPGSTDAVPEGSTNLYYTQSRADARVAAAVGSSVQAWSPTLDSWAGKSVPTGAAVGTNDTQTLTNKTISGATNTLSDVPVSAIGATGTADDTTYLRGDGQWATPEGSGGAETFNQFLLMGA